MHVNTNKWGLISHSVEPQPGKLQSDLRKSSTSWWRRICPCSVATPTCRTFGCPGGPPAGEAPHPSLGERKVGAIVRLVYCCLERTRRLLVGRVNLQTMELPDQSRANRANIASREPSGVSEICCARLGRGNRNMYGPQKTYRPRLSATQQGFSWPSTSITTSLITSIIPPLISTVLSVLCVRTRDPTGTGAGNRTLLKP